MSIQVVAVLWILSCLTADFLARKRGLKFGIPARVFGTLLGPLAIPIIFLFKPELSS